MAARKRTNFNKILSELSEEEKEKVMQHPETVLKYKPVAYSPEYLRQLPYRLKKKAIKKQ